MKLPNNQIGNAIDKAWLWFIRDVEHSVTEHARDDIHGLEDEVNDLKDVLGAKHLQTKWLDEKILALQRYLDGAPRSSWSPEITVKVISNLIARVACAAIDIVRDEGGDLV
ncbi:hypothetical protein JB92DRAFT_3115013 [Gautieria morchelliformis]|nr:hypothetical protein JB92DRAFT_3115013 [Gautieria morchelliformis]